MSAEAPGPPRPHGLDGGPERDVDRDRHVDLDREPDRDVDLERDRDREPEPEPERTVVIPDMVSGDLWDAETLDRLRTAVKDADLVSFDVFDTLLVRSVTRPVDAFGMIDELVNQRTDHFVLCATAEARLEAERELREWAWHGRGASPETVTLDAIWREVQERTDYDDELVAVLQAHELEIERLLLRAPPSAGELFRFAVDQGKDVMLLSDTYFPKAFLASVLADHGLTGYRELWVSCEEGVAKSDGSMWARLAQRHRGARIVHVGDDPHADLVWARAVGVSPRHMCKPSTALWRQLGTAGETLRGDHLWAHLHRDGFKLVNTHRSALHSLTAQMITEKSDASPAYAAGYGALGPLLVGYSQWLHRAATDAGHDHLFFLARDGHVMQRAYRALLGDEALPSTYLAASRRLYNMAAIGDALTGRDVEFLAQTATDVTVGEFFSRLGLPQVEAGARSLLAEIGLDPSASGRDHHAAVRACFWQLSDELAAAAAAERQLVLEYWDQEGLMSAARPAAVDIGWHGSLERSMRRVLRIAGAHDDLQGFYFGLHPVRGAEPGYEPQAYVDGARERDLRLHHDLIFTSVAVLEFCFTRPEGTVLGLERVADGSLVARHASDRPVETDRAVLADLQTAALEYVADFAEATRGWPGPLCHVEREAAVESMLLLVTQPTVRAADLFGRRLHGDGFGDGVTWEPIGAPRRDASYYVDHPRALAAEAARASWKQGFARNAHEMGLALPPSLALPT